LSLRPYQQAATDAAIDWIKKSVEPCVIEAPTGAGKSHIIAELAHWVLERSNKRVLVLAPSGELVEQNYGKYLATGNSASMFSASVGKKETRHPVVFGSPLTVAKNLKRFTNYAAIVIDEAHGLTPTMFKIIGHMRNDNPKIRIIGLTATPYRMNQGYIYEIHHKNGVVDSIDPFFKICVYDISAQKLIDDGYLSKPVFDLDHENYDTSDLVLKSTGKWDASTVDKAFSGHGRKTSRIVEDIVEKSEYRNGVMIFAATVKHAEEIMESLPSNISRLVTAKTTNRAQIISAFKDKRIKYIVNVSCLTTGFDAAHVDVIAILRATESAGLLTQIVGRGLRICENKNDCLILDYAENMERHFKNNDIFHPEIKSKKKAKGEPIKVICPLCSHHNHFSARINKDGFELSENGYFLDLDGIELETPSHYGRRCTGVEVTGGTIQRCGYKWTCKKCEKCEHENDIAARYCKKCKCELVNPNDNLREKIKPVIIFDDVIDMNVGRHKTANGETLKIEYVLKSKIITQWIKQGTWYWKSFTKFSSIDEVLDHAQEVKKPNQIAYKKEGNYWRFVSAQ